MRGTLLIALACAGCTPWASQDERRDAQVSADARVPADADAADARVSTDADAADSGRGPCPALSERATQRRDVAILGDETWSCDNVYVLGGEVHVHAPATITIEPGTVVMAEDEAALVFRPGARLVADGRPEAPIVFTSDDAPLSHSPGEWRGLALMGRAAPVGTLAEGLETNLAYGGTDDAHDCGTLRYVRIEWAGDNIDDPQEGNATLGGLVLAGCGTGTVVDFVQVHQSEWEGIKVRGGSVRLRHLVLTESGDEALEWAGGWTGSAQYVLARQQSSGGVALQADGPGRGPIIANATLVGMVGTRQARDGFFADDEAEAVITNAIFTGWSNSVLDVEDSSVSTAGEPPLLRVDRSITFFSPLQPVREEADGFDEQAHLAAVARMNRLDLDPLLVDTTISFDLRPGAESPVGIVGCPDDARVDSGACYAGGLAPGEDDWSIGWTNLAE